MNLIDDAVCRPSTNTLTQQPEFRPDPRRHGCPPAHRSMWPPPTPGRPRGSPHSLESPASQIRLIRTNVRILTIPRDQVLYHPVGEIGRGPMRVRRYVSDSGGATPCVGRTLPTSAPTRLWLADAAMVAAARVPAAWRNISVRTGAGMEISAGPSSRSSWRHRSSDRAPGTWSKTAWVRPTPPMRSPSGRTVGWPALEGEPPPPSP